MFMEPELTSLGPAADTLDAPDRGGMTSKPIEAWRDDTDNSGAAVTRDGSMANGDASGARSAPRPRYNRRRQWRRRAAVALVALQALWAVVISLKNIGVTMNPPTRPDQTSLSAQTYAFNASSSGSEVSVFLGSELMPLIRQVARSTLGSQSARRELERAGSFDLDRVYSLLPLDDFAAVAQFYALEMQSAAFPAVAFTPRPIPTSSSSSDASSLVTLVLSDSTTTSTNSVEIQLACSQGSAFLPAMKCTQTANGEPCPEGATVSSDGDDQVANSTLYSFYSFTDVGLLSTTTGGDALSGLRNNVGLLFVVEFFSQAMSALLAARDWENALQDLAFAQSVDEALPVGSASAFTASSEGNSAPYLLATDAYLVGVRAALMQSSLLDSCVASELTVALFYSRTPILHEIRQVLLELELYNVRSGPSILLPGNSDAVLAPMWESNVSLTSGARASTAQREDTRFFGSLVRVATREFADATFKADRSSVSSMQVSGSSLRMVQYLSFFPGLVSAFSYGTRQVQSGNSADGVTDYDFQSFALLGAAGAGINTFQESVAGAGSAMVFPIAEIPDSESSDNVDDSWWDDETRLASWFRALEADATSAPFGVFGSNLTIQSVAPSIVTDGNTDTRCHRALFKVLAKITYLSMVAASKPASYLMFMGDVDEDHRAWLLRNIDTEELFGETLFGAGDRVGLPFRSGKFTRKDDGSAWVIVPMLESMIDAFGRDDVLALLTRELDDSFGAFVAGSSGGVLHFPDARYCHVSGIGTAIDGTTSLVVTTSDSLEEIYAKISSGLAASLEALLDEIPALAAAMLTSRRCQRKRP